MVTVDQIKATALAVAEKEGYTVPAVGTRLNGDGSTGFLWELRKDSKKYRLTTTAVLANITERDLPTLAIVFRTDLSHAKEY